MSKLFKGNDSDSDESIKINKGYAVNYNNWRRKEELNKLKTKYGEQIDDLKSSDDESDSSSGNDEGADELPEEFEKDFYKTLACLKKRDPRIYDENVNFFSISENAPENTETEFSKRKTKLKPFTLRDYERKMIIERSNQFSESDDECYIRNENHKINTPTYVEEQTKLKENINQVLLDRNDDNDTDLLLPKDKSQEEKVREEESYKEWLRGQETEVDTSEKKVLKPLRDFWTNPTLDKDEKFLRDYVLNKKFLESDGKNNEDIISSNIENLSEDEKHIDQQEVFEHKFNFRFEEPDREFLKRYPRTLGNSVRKKDSRRSEKRIEVKKRKGKEKEKKREELKRLKALKRKEILEKIAQLKEITGNNDIHFDSFDLEGDFDSAEHDKKMTELFSEKYYEEGDDHVKPVFPDMDEELEIENTWDDYAPNIEEIKLKRKDAGCHGGNVNLNMDADYVSTKPLQVELLSSSRRKRRRRSKFAEMMSKDKPKFDPNFHTSYKQYFDQYYGLDYEDMIGDLPCRFKYRNVVSNDYGLSVEEILMADDKELNKWCSLKKALEHKSEHQELQEVKIYQEKSSNEKYKKKILRSLYEPLDRVENNANDHKKSSSNTKKKSLKKSSQIAVATSRGELNSLPPCDNKNSRNNTIALHVTNNNKNTLHKATHSASREGIGGETSNARKKVKNGSENLYNQTLKSEGSDAKRALRKHKYTQVKKMKKSKNLKDSKNTLITSLGDERLKAYGIMPKKFKKKMKYGLQSIENSEIIVG